MFEFPYNVKIEFVFGLIHEYNFVEVGAIKCFNESIQLHSNTDVDTHGHINKQVHPAGIFYNDNYIIYDIPWIYVQRLYVNDKLLYSSTDVPVGLQSVIDTLNE